jgi:DNA repair exonuclease SbcCD ATPase subunit
MRAGARCLAKGGGTCDFVMEPAGCGRGGLGATSIHGSGRGLRGSQSPKFHQSPALLRVASHQRRRAEVAEKSNQDLQQQRSALAQENEALKREVAELRRQLDEARQAQQAAGKAPGSGQGPHKGGGPRGERQRGASADRPEQDMAARLRHCQQMYRELSAVAEELRRIHEAEQQRSADQDRLLQEALALAIEREPPLSGDWSAESAARRTAASGHPYH